MCVAALHSATYILECENSIDVSDEILGRDVMKLLSIFALFQCTTVQNLVALASRHSRSNLP